MRAVSLVTDADGSVTGVRFEGPDGPVEVSAGAVVLATGGFEWDAAMVRSFIRGPLVRSASVPTNTGDGLKMAMRVGAGLGNMREAWWVPIIDVPIEGKGTAGWQVNGERTRPHSIMVNSLGRRFTNEAANYNALGAAFHVIDVNTYDLRQPPRVPDLRRPLPHQVRPGGLQVRYGSHPWLDHRGAVHQRARGQAGPPGRRAAGHDRAVELPPRARRGRRLRSGQRTPRQVVGGSGLRRQPAVHDRPDRHPALLRGARVLRSAGHQGRPADRRHRAGARPRRRARSAGCTPPAT